MLSLSLSFSFSLALCRLSWKLRGMKKKKKIISALIETLFVNFRWLLVSSVTLQYDPRVYNFSSTLSLKICYRLPSVYPRVTLTLFHQYILFFPRVTLQHQFALYAFLYSFHFLLVHLLRDIYIHTFTI